MISTVKGGGPATHMLHTGGSVKYRKGSTGLAEIYLGNGEWGFTIWENDELDSNFIFVKIDDKPKEPM